MSYPRYGLVQELAVFMYNRRSDSLQQVWFFLNEGEIDLLGFARQLGTENRAWARM